MKYFFIILLAHCGVFGAGGPYSSYDDFSRIERHVDFMEMERCGLFDSAQGVAEEEFSRLEAQLDLDEGQGVVPHEWFVFNQGWKVRFEGAIQEKNHSKGLIAGVLSQRSEILQGIGQRIKSGAQEGVMDHEKDEISALDGHLNEAFCLYALRHEASINLMRERFDVSREMYPVLYARNIWNMEKELNRSREEMLGEFVGLSSPSSEVLLEEHMRQGMNIAKTIYSKAGQMYSQISGENFSQEMESVMHDVDFQMQTSGDYADRVELCRIRGELSKFPILGMIGYITLKLDIASEQEKRAMIPYQMVLKVHKPAIERFFEQLYPGAILHNIFVTRGAISQELFHEFMKNLEDQLGWRLPSGL